MREPRSAPALFPRFLQWVPDGLWTLVLLTLPITSFPLLVHLTRGAIVAVAAGIPLAALILIWTLPRILKSRSLPFEVSPLLGFALAAAVAGLLSFFVEIYPFKGETTLSRQVEAWATLGLGMAFFLVSAGFVSHQPSRLRSTLTWLLVGLGIALLWSAVQAYFVACCEGEFPHRIRELHRLISIRDPSAQRVTGMAYEPSWFAHQLNMLYFPLLIASIMAGRSAFRGRVFGISLEWPLLVGGVAALVLSTSRIGLAGFILLAALATIWLAVRLARATHVRIWRLLAIRFPNVGRIASTLGAATLWLVLLAVFVAGAFGLVVGAARLDWRWERILAPAGTSFFSIEYANYLLFSERAVYWMASYRVFENFPLLGVGLGNTGFFIPDVMPAFAWALPEVVEVMSPGTEFFPNPKSLWLRLLAETGIVGAGFYVTWLLLMGTRAIRLARSERRIKKTIGFMGLLSLAAALVEGFSIDSFAFPYLWVAMGLVVAAARLPDEYAASES